MINFKNQIAEDITTLNEKLPKGMLEENQVIAKSFIQTANLFYDKKNYSLAISNFEKAFEILNDFDKNDAQFIYKLGLASIYEAKDSSEIKGIKYLKKSLEIEPTVDFMASVGIYLGYKRLGEYDSAIYWLDYTLNKFYLNTAQKELLNNWKK